MIPEWAHVPFFKPTPTGATRRSAPARVRHLADAPDHDVIEEIITGSELDGFDPDTIQKLWAASVAGDCSAAGEAALQQALWQASFEHHLTDINRHLTDAARTVATRAPAVAAPGAAAPGPPVLHPAAQGARRAAAESRLVRCLARQPVWRGFRRTRLGRSWRSLSRPN
jgi:hypothetical protein